MSKKTLSARSSVLNERVRVAPDPTNAQWNDCPRLTHTVSVTEQRTQHPNWLPDSIQLTVLALTTAQRKLRKESVSSLSKSKQEQIRFSASSRVFCGQPRPEVPFFCETLSGYIDATPFDQKKKSGDQLAAS